MLLLRPLYIYSSLLLMLILILSCLRAGCCMLHARLVYAPQTRMLCAMHVHIQVQAKVRERERRTIEADIESEREGARIRV